jgi:acetolactate decarboxylase
MRNVFWEGQISGAIDLDTIANKEHLYGLGPMEFLSGELLILDGISYKSTVAGDGTPVVDVTYRVKAPFFVYANVDTWREQILPDTVRTIEQLEPFLDNATKTTRRPFAFKLTGKVDSARFHIVNLPKGATVSSPTDAHRVEQSSLLTNRDCDILGFFSREHKGVFTHHDTFVHLHIITGDRTRMGHLDGVQLGKGTIKLSLPAESVR